MDTDEHGLRIWRGLPAAICAGALLRSETKTFVLFCIALVWCGVAVAEVEENGHGSAHKNHVAVFLGATSTSGGQHGATIGADYGYRVHDFVSLALAVDYAGGEIDTTILAAGVFLHATDALRLLIAPGIDYHNGYEDAVLRLGVLYDFHVGAWTLSPTVHLDALEAKENAVYGLSVGHGF